MSIADKITSIENHLSADYEGLENIGADLTGINKNILNIRTILDTIYNDMPKVTGEGTEVILTPTLKGKLGIVEKGNSTQFTTTGKNLADMSDYTSTNTDTKTSCQVVAYLGNESARTHTTIVSTTTISSTGIKSFTFTISDADSFSYSTIRIKHSGSTRDLTANGSVVNITNGTYTLSLDFTGINVQAVGGFSFKNVMLESGGTATSYEQYTGGIPAPNPSYPFPIKSVTGNNNVVVNSANLLSQSNLEWGNISTTTGENGGGSGTFIRTKTFIKVSGGSKYSGNYTKSTGLKQYILYKYDSNKNYLGYDIYDSADNFTKTLENNVNYIRLRLLSVGSTETEILNNISDVIFNNGDVIPYVPYQNQTKPLNLGTIELNKIGNYQDYIYKNNDKWYKHEEIGKVVLDGTNNTLSKNSLSVGSYLYYSNKINHNAVGAICDHFIEKDNYPGGQTDGGKFNSTLSAERFYFNSYGVVSGDNATAGANEFNEWLSTHNVLVKYVLATPNDIEITDTQLIEQLEEIDKMKSYNGTTIITSTYDTNNAQMIISASGLKGE